MASGASIGFELTISVLWGNTAVVTTDQIIANKKIAIYQERATPRKRRPWKTIVIRDILDIDGSSGNPPAYQHLQRLAEVVGKALPNGCDSEYFPKSPTVSDSLGSVDISSEPNQ